MTYLLLILTFFIWPFGHLLNFQIPGLSLVFYPLDIACGLLALSLLLFKSGRKKILSDPLFKPLLFFIIAAILSLLFNYEMITGGEVAYPLFYLLRLVVYPSVYFAIKLFSPQKYLSFILMSLIAFSFIGLFQYLIFPDMRFLKYLGFDDHYFRLIGSLFDPNFTGAILAASALVFISLSSWGVALSFIAMLALTFSRASYVAFVFGFIYLFIFKKNWKLFGLLLLLAVLIIAIPKPFGEGVNLLRTFSIFSRINSWQTGWSLFVEQPVFGWGYNTLRSITGERFQIDNSFLYVAATTGIVGLISLVSLLKHGLSIVSLPQKVFIFAILVHSLFNNTLFYIWIFYAIWVVLAIDLRGYKSK